MLAPPVCVGIAVWSVLLLFDPLASAVFVAVCVAGSDADANAKQDAVNADVPLSIAGGDSSGGSTSATQTASNTANGNAYNDSKTKQDAYPTQTGGAVTCGSGCGGPSQHQSVLQRGRTWQHGRSKAVGRQGVFNL